MSRFLAGNRELTEEALEMRERKTPENKEGLLHARRPCNLGLGICAEAERRSSQLQPVTVGRRRGV